ncbi:hypothetical protein [Paracoccus sp. PARArs4]|uniref:hypothetical protein n=1 Tax=Paracoccus sp. PARArs4 TaxID=2853442 RepID=UPI0024A74D52|nr:hypothetical protein [Paracoccus sp. PARArs4]
MLKTIGMLWLQGPLSYLEQLCVKSFLDAGHRVVLYHYGPLQNVPEGVELADANEVLPQSGFLRHERTGSPALHSDLFRYKMLAKEDNVIWADTDAYCMKPFQTRNGHFYGWEGNKHINGGVLGLPKDSDTLRALLDFTNDEFSIPTWYGDEYTQELQAAKNAGMPVHAGDQPWGVWGPHAVTHFLHATGEVKYALPQEALYPFKFKDRRLMLRRNFDTTPYITENTYSVHLFGRRMRARLVEKEGGVPHRSSLLGKLLTKHGIDPCKAPIPNKGRPEPAKETPTGSEAVASTATPRPTMFAPLHPSVRYGRGEVNLTDLADKYGSDKGSAKHRYSELYQMLFLPYRNRTISFLEMGLQIGGPEHGNNAARPTTDAPSVRMWLEFFPKAKIHGLDVSDFSWFKDPRFVFHCCDMDRRENIRAATSDIKALDIVIDDASHASHHQQNGLLELFGKVKSGGLYIIEDLRWQPKDFETLGYPKTATLFQSYLEASVFRHPEPAIEKELNDMRVDISGCFLFQAQFQKNRRDQVLVIHKR